MVVVLRYEKEMIDKAHGLLQARMQKRVDDDGMFKRIEPIYELRSSGSKFSKDVLYLACIVIGFVRSAILQIGWRERRLAFHKIVDTRTPQFFQVKQMTGLFLDGPFLAVAGNQQIAWPVAKHFLETRRGSAQAYA